VTEPAIDGTAVEEKEEGNAVVGQQLVRAEGAALTVAPAVEAEELVTRLQTIRQAADTAMTKGVDYGEIPGTDKPALLKPGAEKLAVLFQLDVQIDSVKTWGPGDHLTVESKAIVYHAPTGLRLGYGEGICSSREKKYAKRRRDLECPECGKAAVLKSKHPKPGEAFFCWRKKDGCGANFDAGDERLTSQKVGEMENPELPDTWNTVVKMAEKRARVDAVLNVTAASALFTQDIEEGVAAAAPAAAPAPEVDPLQVNAARPAEEADTAGAGKALALLFDTGEGPDEHLAQQTLARIAADNGLGYLPNAATYALRVAGGLLSRKLETMRNPQPQAQAEVSVEEARAAAEAAREGEVVNAELVPESQPQGDIQRSQGFGL
jgi:hypothetical protein